MYEQNTAVSSKKGKENKSQSCTLCTGWEQTVVMCLKLLYYDDIARRSVYRNVQFFFGSETNVLNVVTCI